MQSFDNPNGIYRQGKPCQTRLLWGEGKRTISSVEAALGSGPLIGSVIRQWGVVVLAGVAFYARLLPSSAQVSY